MKIFIKYLKIRNLRYFMKNDKGSSHAFLKIEELLQDSDLLSKEYDGTVVFQNPCFLTDFGK